jgi:hypothetical protein
VQKQKKERSGVEEELSQAAEWQEEMQRAGEGGFDGEACEQTEWERHQSAGQQRAEGEAVRGDP